MIKAAMSEINSASTTVRIAVRVSRVFFGRMDGAKKARVLLRASSTETVGV
jgi:hypothetical protein